MLLNCTCWAKYGVLMDQLTIIVVNLVGVAFALYYLYAYDQLTSAPLQSRVRRKQIMLPMAVLYIVLFSLRFVSVGQLYIC